MHNFFQQVAIQPAVIEQLDGQQLAAQPLVAQPDAMFADSRVARAAEPKIPLCVVL